MLTSREFMSTEVISVEPGNSIEEAISLLLKHGLSSLPVVDPTGRLLGVVSELDLLELISDPKTDDDEVRHYMTRNVESVDLDADLDSVAKEFRSMGVRRLPVVRHGIVVGIIAREDLLRHVLQVRGQIAPVVPRPLPATDAPHFCRVGS